jgi:two-component system CheB/CheR fusion protein
LSVRDTGIGIAPALLPSIFTALAQGEQSLDRPHGGLGLGLSVVKGLVELHGGTVEARSAGTGQGAEFIVRLSREPEPAAFARPPHSPMRAGQGQRVLVIEDNRDAAESLRMLLELLGHEVRVAYTGPEAVQTASQWQPHVVISDIGLPGLDGYEVARRLRQVPELRGALLVALTGYGAAEDRQQALGAGFDHHLVKPADAADLQRLLAVTR